MTTDIKGRHSTRRWCQFISALPERGVLTKCTIYFSSRSVWTVYEKKSPWITDGMILLWSETNHKLISIFALEIGRNTVRDATIELETCKMKDSWARFFPRRLSRYERDKAYLSQYVDRQHRIWMSLWKNFLLRRYLHIFICINNLCCLLYILEETEWTIFPITYIRRDTTTWARWLTLMDNNREQMVGSSFLIWKRYRRKSITRIRTFLFQIIRFTIFFHALS